MFLPEPLQGDKPPLAMQMMEMGFDVYLSNISGTDYSYNKMYSSDQPEYWQMDWRKYGVYDMPAFVGEIRKRNGGKKVAYVGHSQGTTQAFAGMAIIPDWYDENISTAAFLGPCTTPNWEQIQDVYRESDFEWMRENDIYVLNGGADWPEQKAKIMASGPPGVQALVGDPVVLRNVPVQALSAYC